jgi:hypothetical protein
MTQEIPSDDELKQFEQRLDEPAPDSKLPDFEMGRRFGKLVIAAVVSVWLLGVMTSITWRSAPVNALTLSVATLVAGTSAITLYRIIAARRAYRMLWMARVLLDSNPAASVRILMAMRRELVDEVRKPFRQLRLMDIPELWMELVNRRVNIDGMAHLHLEQEIKAVLQVIYNIKFNRLNMEQTQKTRSSLERISNDSQFIRFYPDVPAAMWVLLGLNMAATTLASLALFLI